MLSKIWEIKELCVLRVVLTADVIEFTKYIATWTIYMKTK